MFTLVHLDRTRHSSTTTTALVADYLLFDRHRRESRPYIQVFAVFAALSLIGGAAGSVPRAESIVAAAVFILPVVVLLGLNAWRRTRLERRLGGIRAEIQQAAHKKVIKTA